MVEIMIRTEEVVLIGSHYDYPTKRFHCTPPYLILYDFVHNKKNEFDAFATIS